MNTRGKRASSVAIFGVVLAPPLPDGAISQADRWHIAFSYSEILGVESGTWTKLDVGSGSWTKLAVESGTWTKLDVGSGSWTRL